MKLRKRLLATALVIATVFSSYGCVGSAATAKNVKVTIKGTSQISKKEKTTFAVKWDDSYFKKSSSEFNSKLAYISMAYSASAYSEKEATNVKNALKGAGFSKISSGNSYSANSKEGIGYTIASKSLTNQADETLIAVVLRGSYGKEWYGNFDIAKDSNSASNDAVHYNFKQAESTVMKALQQYYKENEMTAEHTKIWITGHSRGAAVANLLAAEVNESTLTDMTNVYAYTFATPNTAKNTTAYDNIFNILNQGDFFTGVPMEKWGFHRYGVDITLDKLFQKAGLTRTQIDNSVAIPFKAFTGDVYGNHSYDVTGMSNVLNQATSMVSDTTNYYTMKLTFGSDKATMYQYFQTIGDLMVGDDNAKATATRKLGKSVLGNDDYSTLSVALMNLAISGNVYFAHMPENYLSWLQIMSDSNMKQNGSMNPIILKKSGKTTVQKGKKATYKVMALGTNKTIKWSVSNKKVAAITSKGVLTGKKKGTVKVTAKAGKAKATYTVKIN